MLHSGYIVSMVVVGSGCADIVEKIEYMSVAVFVLLSKKSRCCCCRSFSGVVVVLLLLPLFPSRYLPGQIIAIFSRP